MSSEATLNVRFDDARNRHLLLALSGGADSVALLVLLCAQRANLNLTITAAHLNHSIRAQAADADAAFCAELCEQLDVELILERRDVPALASERRQGIETAAREARYAFLREAQRKCGADWIVLAHHRDDQAETIMMHLLRGAGSEGMSGMARLKDGLYRPLLDVSKAQLKAYLLENGFHWREDATNTVDDNPRNALRLNVLPEIEKSYPSATAAIARYGHIAREESELLSKMTDRFLAEYLESGVWGKRLILNGYAERAILRRAIRRVCPSTLSMEKTDEILALANLERGSANIFKNLRAEKTPDALYFLPLNREKPAPVHLNIPGETALNGICRVTAEIGNFSIEANDPYTEVFNADALVGACLRTRQEGDRIHPLGAPGEKLLSDYLTDRKMDRPLREWLPLVTVGNQVLWACGVGMSDRARLKSDTMRMVRLKINFTDEKAEVLL